MEYPRGARFTPPKRRPRFGEATIVAAIGLAVNLLSAWLLFDDDHHHDAHDTAHAHKHDTNIRAAYLQVLATR